MDEQDKILNTNPFKYIVAGLLVIAFFFGGLTIWSVYFPFQGAVIAGGMVKVSGDRQTVQHLEGGMIDKIYVKDGTKVTAGDVLIELKSTQVNSNVDLIQGRLWAKQAEAARLSAEAVMESAIDWPDEFKKQQDDSEIATIMATEENIFTSRRADLKGKNELYKSQILQLEKRINGAKQEYNSSTEIIQNLQEDLKSKLPLLKEQYIGKTNILELQRSLSEYKGKNGRLNQDIAQFRQMIEELKLRIVDQETQYKDQAVSRLGELSDIIYELKEQIKPQLDAKERLKIRAPVSGIVIDMQIHSEETGVIRPGMPLLDIVPENSGMIIKAEVRPQDITSVRMGQKTKVALAAFHRKSTPPVNGKVTYVSPDLITQQTPRGTMSFYEVYVEVDNKDLEEKNAYLSPGMPVSCYITTDVRTVISYLLGPLLQNVDTAMRE